MSKHLEQHQVPDGMVANVPWGYPFDRWNDRMVERGLKHLADTEGETFFPVILNALNEEARTRGIQV